MSVSSACTGSSPYSIKGLPEDDYQLLVIGNLGQQQASRVLAFDVPPRSTEPFEVSVTNQTQLNGSIVVVFSSNRERVDFQCSVSGCDFFTCEF